MALLIDAPQNLIVLNDGEYGYQEILFTTPKVGTDSTGLAAGPSYEFNFQTNPFGGTNGTSFTFGAPPTFNTLVSSLNSYFTSNTFPAQATMYNGALRIVNTVRGSLSVMRLDDLFYVNKLFSDITDFSAFGPLVDGSPLLAYHEVLLTTTHLNSDPALAAGTYTVDIIINGIQSFFTVTTTLSTAYGDIPSLVNAKLTNGWVEFYRDRFVVHSHVGGDSTSVNANGFGGDTLFSSVTDFSAFGTAVPGSNGTLSTPVIYMGPSSAVHQEFAVNETGMIEVFAGAGATSGGDVNVYAGNTAATNGTGGNIVLQAGSSSVGAGFGGNVEILAGSADITGQRGNVNIAGGEGGLPVGGGGGINFYTNGLQRLTIGGLGAWNVSGGGSGVAGQVITSNGTSVPPSWQYPVTPIAGMVVGTPPPSGIVLNFVAVGNYTIPDDFAGSQAKAQTAATASTTFNVYRNGILFGTINFAAASAVGTFLTSAGAEVFTTGDILTIVAPVIVDASLADIGITIVITP